jgi:CRP-like cAMP-binding protein
MRRAPSPFVKGAPMDGSAIETQALRSTPFFSGLPPEDLEGILRVGQAVSFAQGDTIVEEGAPGDAMYIVISGLARVEAGGRFHDLKAGAFFGEMALITSKRRMATVTATEPVEALRIPADAFQAFLMEHPAVGLSMMKALVDRLREVEQRIDAWMAS